MHDPESVVLMDEPSSVDRDLLVAIQRLTEVIDAQTTQQRSLYLSLRNGLLAGLGGVIGATVVVSIIIAITQPFRRLDSIGPMIDHLDNVLQQSPRR